VRKWWGGGTGTSTYIAVFTLFVVELAAAGNDRSLLTGAGLLLFLCRTKLAGRVQDS